MAQFDNFGLTNDSRRGARQSCIFGVSLLEVELLKTM
jgi:hypothetical protein